MSLAGIRSGNARMMLRRSLSDLMERADELRAEEEAAVASAGLAAKSDAVVTEAKVVTKPRMVTKAGRPQ